MKLGRWEVAGGRTYTISRRMPEGVCPWVSECGMCWTDEGKYWPDGKPDHLDLVRYLGPIELSQTPACAEAGPAGDPQTVSTEGPQESLKRMKRLEATIHRELEIYLPLVARLKTTASDLDEAIKMLEKEVEG